MINTGILLNIKKQTAQLNGIKGLRQSKIAVIFCSKVHERRIFPNTIFINHK
jgi:hypothetical protein